MISKFYELIKFKNKINCYLFYGENDGQKLDTIENNFKELGYIVGVIGPIPLAVISAFVLGILKV